MNIFNSKSHHTCGWVCILINDTLWQHTYMYMYILIELWEVYMCICAQIIYPQCHIHLCTKCVFGCSVVYFIVYTCTCSTVHVYMYICPPIHMYMYIHVYICYILLSLLIPSLTVTITCSHFTLVAASPVPSIMLECLL